MSQMFPHADFGPDPAPAPSAIPTPPAALPPRSPHAALRRKLQGAAAALALLVFGFGTASALIPIGGAVIGAGQVGVASRVKRIAHPTGGVIAEILVANGDHVVAGQPLIRLDDRVSGTDADLSELTVTQLIAQRARLEAERLAAGAIRFPAELTGSGDPGARQAMADEARLFALHAGESAGIRAQIAARVMQHRQEIAGYRAQIAALQAQQALIAPERRGVRELWDKQLVTIDRLNQLERTAVDMTGSIAALGANIAQAEARISEARQQMIQAGETRRAEAAAQLAQVNAALNDQTLRSVTARDQHDRAVIRAPYAGTIDKLGFSTIGGVVRAAETIMEIVPDHDRLVVEAMVSPADIDQVRQGQRARIRFSSFNTTASPQFDGTVTVVAPERTVEQNTQRTFYEIRVAIDQAALARERGMTLKPGMPAEVYVETGSRSMLSYLLKPLRDQFARSFRDN